MDRVVASWFGTGLLLRSLRGADTGSGTVASVVAFAISVWVGLEYGWIPQAVTTVVLVLASIWAAGRFSEEGDAGWIVIDEAAGTFLATIGLTLGPAFVAFVVFRLADIFKVPGVKQAERLPGAIGVTADDVVAGLYGLAVGHAVQALVG